MSVQKRSAGIYSRIVVPLDLVPRLGRRELVRSLRTQLVAEAKGPAAAHEAACRKLFAILRRDPTLTRDQAIGLSQRYEAEALAHAESSASAGDHAARREEWELNLVAQLQAREDALQAGDFAEVVPVAVELLEAAGLPVDVHGGGFRLLCQRLMAAKQRTAQAELWRLTSGLPRDGLTPVAPGEGGAGEGDTQGLLLSEAIADFVATKRAAGAWTAKTDRLFRGVLAEALDMIGDRSVVTITKADLLAYSREVPQLPAWAITKFPGMTARELLEHTRDMKIARLSPVSINKRFALLRALWDHLARLDIVPRNIAADVLLDVPKKRAADQRPAMTPAEVTAVLKRTTDEAKADKAKAAHRWLPLVLAYSGMRLEEAASLRVEDVQEHAGVLCFNVQGGDAGRLKTAASRRLVPVHPELLRKGLRDHVESRRRAGGNLWGLQANRRSGLYGAAVSKWINRRIQQTVGRPGVVAHSFRHTVATVLKDAEVPEYLISEILGHTVRGITAGRYGKRVSVQRLAEVVQKVNYGGRR